MTYTWADIPQIWVVDFEFLATPGSPQIPIWYVAREVSTGKTIKKYYLKKSFITDWKTNSLEKTSFVGEPDIKIGV